MSTDRRELRQLQAKARKAGRICTFFAESDDASIDAVFYINRIIDPLSFAERERSAPWAIA